MSRIATTQTAPAKSLNQAEPYLRFLVPLYPEAGTPIRLSTSRMIVGRAGGGATIEVDDPRMSRAHFELRRARQADVLHLRDLDSKNGTLVDGQPVTEAWLQDGAVIRSGDTLFAFVERPAPPGELRAPVAGKSVALCWAEALVDQVAPTMMSVLITGPTGAGKELLASRVHAASGRGGRFVAVNCATLPRELLASELFGHAKGAFSGASGARQGLFRSAEGGTLFLDEVAELPLEQQPALLRVLQERAVRPVGSDREIPVDVRVVAATLKPIERLDTDTGFRTDLRARLEGVGIELPGLVRRRGDILPLFRMFLNQPVDIDSDTAELLLVHDWPENVRGLKHVAERVRLFAGRSGRLRPAMLPSKVQRAARARAATQVGGEKLDRERAIALLRTHKGKVAQVARALGQSRQKIYRRLEALNLDPADYR